MLTIRKCGIVKTNAIATQHEHIGWWKHDEINEIKPADVLARVICTFDVRYAGQEAFEYI